MELVNTFIVPAPVEDAWNLLTDVARIGPCLPGATVEPLGDDRYAGHVSVKAGPIKVGYSGEASFRTVDAQARSLVLDARGTERNGRGSAAAVIAVDLAPAGGHGTGGTEVTVVTDLQVTGKVAQFGRGAMRDVSGRLIDQFAANLATMLGEPAGTAPGSSVAPVPVAARPEPASDLDALTLLPGPTSRAAVPVAAFVLGILASSLIGVIRGARTSAKPVAPHGYGRA